MSSTDFRKHFTSKQNKLPKNTIRSPAFLNSFYWDSQLNLINLQHSLDYFGKFPSWLPLRVQLRVQIKIYTKENKSKVKNFQQIFGQVSILNYLGKSAVKKSFDVHLSRYFSSFPSKKKKNPGTFKQQGFNPVSKHSSSWLTEIFPASLEL